LLQATQMTVSRAGGAFASAWPFWIVAAILVFAPLIRGGNRPLPLMVLELGALLLVCAVVLHAQVLQRQPPMLRRALLLLLLVPGLHLLPLPVSVLALSDARAAYLETLDALGLGAGWASWSVAPQLTEAAWLAVLPALAVFVTVHGLTSARVARLVKVFLAMAGLQAVLALLQFGAAADSPLWLGMDTAGDSGSGTYPSRNNLAGLLEMALPVAVALLGAAAFGLDRATQARQTGRTGVWARIKRVAGVEGQANAVIVYSLLCLVILLGLTFSRSRTGIALGMLALVLMGGLLMRNFGSRLTGQVVGVTAGAAVLLGAAIGLAPVLIRFAQDPLADGRWAILGASWQAMRDYLPFGSGAGTYAEVIRAYHPSGFGGDVFINHAHNDYLEWMVEGGVLALLLLVLFAALYVAAWRKVWSIRNWDGFNLVQVGAGVGVLMLLLHGLTDFNLRIPANQIYFAFLAAVFLHPEAGLKRANAARGARAGDTPARPPRESRKRSAPVQSPAGQMAEMGGQDEAQGVSAAWGVDGAEGAAQEARRPARSAPASPATPAGERASAASDDPWGQGER
jgi:hypothetical protein